LGGYLALFGEAEDAVPDFFSAWTWSFGTKDASGSTLQAANVIDALKSGALALLVDKDVSAANFMARDGRMRVMITDKPITPLLYSVNSLFRSKEQGASTVVMVGRVGEWLAVADAVILMRNYEAHDGLTKARIVSYQFSYGHV
jgi:predicted ABC-class ATPase